MLIKAPFASLLLLLSTVSLAFGLEHILSLSLQQFGFWQPLTFSFVLASPRGFTFSWLISLIVSTFLLWFVSSALQMKHRLAKTTLAVALSCIGVAGLSLLTLFATGATESLQGPSPLIYSLLVIWLLTEPHLKIALFGLVPIEPKTLLAVFFGLDTISHLAEHRYVSIASDAFGLFVGLLIALLLFRVQWPWRRRKTSASRKDKVVEITNWRDAP